MFESTLNTYDRNSFHALRVDLSEHIKSKYKNIKIKIGT